MFMVMMNRHIAVPTIEFGCNEIRNKLNEQRMKFFKWAIIVSMGGLILGHGTDSSGTCFVLFMSDLDVFLD